jgi:hypothetical protein
VFDGRPRTSRAPRPATAPPDHDSVGDAEGAAGEWDQLWGLDPSACRGLELRDSGVTWLTTTDAGRFLVAAEGFLLRDVVANNAVLTEARFWSSLSQPPPGARFGWWTDASGTQGAFVQIPEHMPICSPLTPAAIAELDRELGGSTSLGVDARDAAAVTQAWRDQGKALGPSARLTLLRLDALRAPALPPGASRMADAGDAQLLRTWFALFQERHPEDRNHVGFVVDEPLRAGAVVVWEVEGRPVAMASRTPVVAGMTRMGLAFQPGEGTVYADAAFLSGCLEASRTAGQVLVLSGSPGSTAAYRALGFVPVAERVVLRLQGTPGS